MIGKKEINQTSKSKKKSLALKQKIGILPLQTAKAKNILKFYPKHLIYFINLSIKGGLLCILKIKISVLKRIELARCNIRQYSFPIQQNFYYTQKIIQRITFIKLYKIITIKIVFILFKQ
ncbi:transmembrane protein, putative (macronuclear) [Tetrahymena thermophila SB210]|uniref:Transmembrane protein, putative n=1 Tax=Tetrahymena thermophila (strain SB210) TaxID=312017 RepID=Q24I04_TETTS|nr:transmembrane protein, putative [Tetrahymena thermophila SB210]EAS07434.2 transmembrane protein, putative [Tetrahymena thermophila SB210]|eukprot:XP_001027676.2 transmembrane protein, putative [Tetrahymena thermophila SB210]